jgi:hypothetical protein
VNQTALMPLLLHNCRSIATGVLVVVNLTVVSVNVCSKKGVQLRLLLLPLVIGSLCRGLCWLVLLHCKVMRLAASKGVHIWMNR